MRRKWRVLAPGLLTLMTVQVLGVAGKQESCRPRVDCDPQDEGRLLEVEFADVAIACDSQEELTDVQVVPEVMYAAGRPGEEYVLLMLDPDAPSRDEATPCFSFLHWLRHAQTNEEGELKAAGDGDLIPFMAPSPPRNTGSHRYQLFLYPLPEGGLDQSSLPTQRAGFSLSQFLFDAGIGEGSMAEFQFLVERD